MKRFNHLFILGVILIGFISLDAAANCDIAAKKPVVIEPKSKYGLWPGLVNPQDLNDGQTLNGFYEAMDKVWANQNPPNCSTAKYLLATGWHSDYARDVHFLGAMLGIAMDTGRVLLQEGGWNWQFRDKHCERLGKRNMECYTLPLSKCTLKDAMNIMTAEHVHNFHSEHQHENHNLEREEPNNHHAPNKTHLLIKPVVEWTEAEDKLLVDMVFEHGKKGHWSIISSKIADKTDVQCYERWTYVTEPMLRRRRGNPSYIMSILDNNDRTIVDFASQHKVVAINRVHDIALDNSTGKMVFSVKHKDTIKDDVLMIDEDLIASQYGRYLPVSLKNIWKCAGLQKGQEFLWWGAIASSYILRPSKNTLDMIEQQRNTIVKDSGGHCISAYVAKCQHSKENSHKHVGWSDYASAALAAFGNKTNWVGMKEDIPKTLFVATEDNKAQAEISVWATKNNVKTCLSSGEAVPTVTRGNSSSRPLPQHLRPQSAGEVIGGGKSSVAGVSGGRRQLKSKKKTEKKTDKKKDTDKKAVTAVASAPPLPTTSVKPIASATVSKSTTHAITNTNTTIVAHIPTSKKSSQKVGVAGEMDFLYFYLNLADEIRCNVHICTMSSENCQLINELRGTVGGKANRLNIDLSTDTCAKPPCFRCHGLANYEGTVYDPKSRLW